MGPTHLISPFQRRRIPVCFFPRLIPKLPAEAPEISQPIPLIIAQPGVTTFPVCGTFGFTAYPNDNDLGVFPPPPVALKDCIWSCRLNHTCKAVSYAAKYQLCSFYSRYMKFDNLDEEKTSSFTHYDEVCPFLEEGKES